MADKPSRALILYADGFAPLVSASHSQLHALASRASCGFLSVRDSPDKEEERLLRELSELLDVHDAHIPRKEELLDQDAQANKELPTMSERFMGMKAAMLTTCPEVDIFGRKLGFSALSFDQLMNLPDAFSAATKLMQYLGFSGGEALEKSDYDLVFVHISPSGNARDQLDWLNALVGGILQIAEPGSGIASCLHLSLVMSFGSVSSTENQHSLLHLPEKDTNSTLSQLFPRQSYSMKGGKLVNDIRHHHPMLVAQWQEAVTRKDMTETFSFEDFQEHGSNLAIVADRFLHEVAFKLWKAPKYGA
ncbi:hypothetical protein H6P81_014684 [Aristolochia fimbriata]|uniref:AT5G11810-like protein n=1 Tax=Aristolochia fimbriata TaxID=158543 RepID=A0AAV7E3F0_ARIFI|nr:hypothetical protein H6P81_014684 [Aristolochia fimbriata]